MSDELMPRDDTHGWRYGSRRYPAPDGIRVTVEFVGSNKRVYEHNGRIFYKMNAGYFGIIDPANGGHAVNLIERGMIRRIEIAAI